MVIVNLSIKGVVIDTNKKGGKIRLNTGKVITCVHKKRLTIGQNVLIYNNNNILSAEAQKEQHHV